MPLPAWNRVKWRGPSLLCFCLKKKLNQNCAWTIDNVSPIDIYFSFLIGVLILLCPVLLGLVNDQRVNAELTQRSDWSIGIRFSFFTVIGPRLIRVLVSCNRKVPQLREHSVLFQKRLHLSVIVFDFKDCLWIFIQKIFFTCLYLYILHFLILVLMFPVNHLVKSYPKH